MLQVLDILKSTQIPKVDSTCFGNSWRNKNKSKTFHVSGMLRKTKSPKYYFHMFGNIWENAKFRTRGFTCWEIFKKRKFRSDMVSIWDILKKSHMSKCDFHALGIIEGITHFGVICSCLRNIEEHADSEVSVLHGLDISKNKHVFLPNIEETQISK